MTGTGPPRSRTNRDAKSVLSPGLPRLAAQARQAGKRLRRAEHRTENGAAKPTRKRSRR
jgi:hypothetical protein